MPYGFLDIAGTPSVQAAQAEAGSDRTYADFRGDRACDRFTAREVDFIARRDTFFMATVSSTGWPYVQHRGGPPGFLRVLDQRSLAFADYRGNRQFITVGNLRDNDRACLILLDQARRERLKIYARAEVLVAEAAPELAAAVASPDYRGKVERIVRLRLEAFDWNCSQHIVQRFTAAEIAEGLEPARQRLVELERENAALRARLR